MGEIRVQYHDAVATLVLSHPERRNALSVAMWLDLQRAFRTLDAEESLRCVVLRGEGGHFAGGADIEEFPSARGDTEQVRRYHEQVIAPALYAVENCRHPTLALIEGACVGGGLEIAARCDLRLCAASARLGVPINRLGFPMAPDELAGLLALAGRAVTLELLLEGRLLGAEEALQKGLVTRVVADAAFEPEAQATIARLTTGAPLAARINKVLVRRLCASPLPLTESERAAAFAYVNSADHREGVSAFLENRIPQFTGA